MVLTTGAHEHSKEAGSNRRRANGNGVTRADKQGDEYHHSRALPQLVREPGGKSQDEASHDVHGDSKGIDDGVTESVCT